MNNNNSSFSKEKISCKDIYEVLSHKLVFQALEELIFKWVWITLENKKSKLLEYRVDFLEKNSKYLIDFFKSEENVKFFWDKISKLYHEHKDSLESLWLEEKHKNSYIYAIATLRSMWEGLSIDKDNTSIEINSLVERVKTKFIELKIIHSNNWNDKILNIVWDKYWNLYR